jgi:hypothetical protein
MKPGDIVTVFGNPIKLENPIGQARLIKSISEHPVKLLEYWEVEYLDNPDYHYQALIRISNETNKASQ